MSVLEQIQALQFSDQAAAAALLKTFIQETFSLAVETVELRPLAVSLNSFNGFMTLVDGQRLFFKTHIEAHGVIGEYYNAAALAEAGYPVLQPILQSTEVGKQFLVYPVIDDPSVFDVAFDIDNGDNARHDDLERAQSQADEQLLRIYQRTLAWQRSDDAAAAPIHQLFYHRLMGGRLDQFYGGGTAIQLDRQHDPISMQQVRAVQWTINGQTYDDTLNGIIERAVHLLQPSQAGPAIVGHGDAHNGNVFLQGSGQTARLLYFDPAFAGRHDPLLDLTKPLFHNVFAAWMYHPDAVAARLRIALDDQGERWIVTHDYPHHPVRAMFLRSKIDRVLTPLLGDLQARGWLRADWRARLKAALFCCPFLTMNLTDARKFPASISLLGLALAVEMGAESQGKRSRIDQILDQVEQALG
ncbi:MAG: hypothetical protein SF162_04555 [bacterium]|nr:hypothetical protein [bacterium]